MTKNENGKCVSTIECPSYTYFKDNTCLLNTNFSDSSGYFFDHEHYRKPQMCDSRSLFCFDNFPIHFKNDHNHFFFTLKEANTLEIPSLSYYQESNSRKSFGFAFKDGRQELEHRFKLVPIATNIKNVYLVKQNDRRGSGVLILYLGDLDVGTVIGYEHTWVFLECGKEREEVIQKGNDYLFIKRSPLNCPVCGASEVKISKSNCVNGSYREYFEETDKCKLQDDKVVLNKAANEYLSKEVIAQHQLLSIFDAMTEENRKVSLLVHDRFREVEWSELDNLGFKESVIVVLVVLVFLILLVLALMNRRRRQLKYERVNTY